MSTESIVVFDLEWNGGWGGVKLNEILQIGAVKLKRFRGPVVDKFRAFVKPTVHKSFNRAAKDLAISKAELDGGESFAAVLERFLAWCGEDCLLASWGPNDLRELRANAEFWDLDVPIPATACDLQAAAGIVAGVKNNVALSAMAEYFGLPDALEFHDALNDAFYAAAVGEMVMLLGGEDVIQACCRSGASSPRKANLQKLRPYVLHTGPRCGGFLREQAALSGPGICRQQCHTCGSPLRIACWFPLGEHSYLTQVTCPEHGPQYFWVTLTRAEKGTWRGKVHTLRTEPAVYALYQNRDKAQVVLCQRSGPKKRRTRYRRGRKNEDSPSG